MKIHPFVDANISVKNNFLVEYKGKNMQYFNIV